MTPPQPIHCPGSFLPSLPFAAFAALWVATAAGDVLAQTSAVPHPPPECGNVTVAELNWASASIIAHIDRTVLEAGFGCDVELIPGDTLSTLNSMLNRGEPDVSPETWINSARDLLDAAAARRDLHYLAPALADGGVEGWWIPAYVAEAHPEIETVADALRRPDLFPAPDGTGAALYGCPQGWSCAVSTANLFEAYEAKAKGFDLIEPESGAALEASIARAFEHRQGWLGYYWAPTAALGRYDLVKLNFDAPYDDELWHNCIIDPDCAAPRITAWPRSEVYTVVTDSFARRASGANRYLSTRTFSNDVLNEILAWQADHEASAEKAARHFFETYPELWRSWLAEEPRRRLAAALSRPEPAVE